ncbi:probable G-protein coupled receptor Mth-like 1 [Aphidius gifuensis]|uniref:probable G-protein coupled receptor Mth-like 1 n=1 Tax=Aphidius gifuensis TaxID=684658 RepID=UPI001CDB776C|nr:probable G-protein coupled receptor Mth-like 1 [Aphidius gifuensis]
MINPLVGKNLYQDLYHMQIPKKCCSYNHIFNDDLICIKKLSTSEPYLNTLNKTESASQCLHNQSMIFIEKYETTSTDYLKFYVPDDVCIEETLNGTIFIAKCRRQYSTILGLGSVVFWGAKTYMSTNLMHVILGIFVILVYLPVPELGRGIHSRAVVQHNICHMMQGIVLQFLSSCELNDCHVNDNLMIFLWLCLQYFTIATVFWLNSICFDMTLAITRFRWMPGSRYNHDGHSRKLLIYGIFSWGGPLIPVVIAGICDYNPNITNEFFLKPNYLNFRNGPSLIVNMYFFLLPMITLLLNNILFIFTTYKIIKIHNSTKFIMKNRNIMLKKKYFLFLNLYMLMGAPWYFGMLFACLNKLFVLKICRLLQPIVWLIIKKIDKANLPCD